VVVLPPVSGGRLRDASLRAWLARSDLRLDPSATELLERIVTVLGLPYPEDGLAALRMWGQTGDRPTVWIAGADPVYLEPRLDHLRLHTLHKDALPPADLRKLFDHLQATLVDDRHSGFVRLGTFGYLRADTPISTAALPAHMVDGQVPSEFMPAGRSAGDYRNLLSEIEMSLHDHEVNQRRTAAGRQPVNSLWIWGGGLAPEREKRTLPPLFANDPLLLGYWQSAEASARSWPGSIADCLKAPGAGFIAVTPEFEDDPAFLQDCLFALRAALRAKRIGSLRILFRDGPHARVENSHRLRVWRRDSRVLD